MIRTTDLPAPIPVPDRFNAADFFLDRHVRDGRGGRTAYRYAGHSVSYGEVAERASRLGNALLARGVQMEQRVLLALPDCPEFAEVFWGAIKIGAVPVPVNNFCVLKEGLTPPPSLEQELADLVRRRLAGYKAPRRVEVVAELPKTATGKIQRFPLRDGA